jgi:hypothetical protein
VLEYHKRGWTSSSAYKVDGEIFNANGQAVYKMDGTWNGKMMLSDMKG